MKLPGERWRAWMDHADRRHVDRVRRGRAMASTGKVTDLFLGPGMVQGEVSDAVAERATVRVRCFEPEVWDRIVDMLASEVGLVVHLVACTFPPDLADRLDALGAPLVPTPAELELDCTCGDFAVPCAHAAALVHVVGDVIAGDPWSLCALRGRLPDQLLADVRGRWNDHLTLHVPRTALPEAPVGGDPYSSPEPLPALLFALHRHAASGALELGPLPGDDDLLRALGPLYEAGAEAAVALATAEGIRGVPRARHTWRTLEELEFDEEAVSDLSERIVDAIASADDGLTRASLARALGVAFDELADELDSLEEMGIVVRTGSRRSPRWWLG